MCLNLIFKSNIAMKNQMVFYICVWLNTKYMRFLNVAGFFNALFLYVLYVRRFIVS